jgi:L-lactate dehydrogenase complex protein LldG
MTAREEMLARVREARVASGLSFVEHPGRFDYVAVPNPLERFAEVSAAGGARVVRTTRSALPALADELGAARGVILSTVHEIAATVARGTSLHALADVELCVLEGQLGVAESGAIWVRLPTADTRAALFLAEHVLLVLRTDAVVGTMHEAYATVDVTASNFGCFVAGPSKTADIEQALVIGAHGPTGLTVALVE